MVQVGDVARQAFGRPARQARAEQNSKGWEMALQNLLAFMDGQSLPHPAGF